MQEIRKKFNFDLRSGDDIFLKISETFLQNLQVYKAQVMVSNFKTQVSVSDFFMKCRFRYKSLIQVVVSTTSLLKTNRDLFLSTWDRVSQKVFSRLRNGTLDHFETEVIKVTFFTPTLVPKNVTAALAPGLIENLHSGSCLHYEDLKIM